MAISESEQLRPTLEKLRVLGFPLHLTDNYVGWIVSELRQPRGLHVVTLNAEMSMQAKQDTQLAHVIQSADLVVPDGSGIVLYFWMRGRKIDRCPGIELSEAVVQAIGAQTSNSIFFFGGKPGVAQAAAQYWQQQIPDLAIAGVQHGYITAEDEQHFCQALQTLQPTVIFVGLGVPRQEFWIAEHRHLCPHSAWIGVGGSLDVWAGNTDRAPQWFCDHHLEWLYRLYQEPWRWRRMLALPKFAWLSLVQR
ncbi:MAG: WecB/TagA/CpsF family glycosyltransferase [Elainellaceae cyanobacterium]